MDIIKMYPGIIKWQPDKRLCHPLSQGLAKANGIFLYKKDTGSG